jgi:hypothetical protein
MIDMQRTVVAVTPDHALWIGPKVDAAFVVAALLACLLASSCADATGGEGTSYSVLPADFDKHCRALMLERKRAGRPPSSRPAGIEWASDLDDAFERAAATDRPVLLLTLTYENGDRDRDV